MYVDRSDLCVYRLCSLMVRCAGTGDPSGCHPNLASRHGKPLQVGDEGRSIVGKGSLEKEGSLGECLNRASTCTIIAAPTKQSPDRAQLALFTYASVSAYSHGPGGRGGVGQRPPASQGGGAAAFSAGSRE